MPYLSAGAAELSEDDGLDAHSGALFGRRDSGDFSLGG